MKKFLRPQFLHVDEGISSCLRPSMEAWRNSSVQGISPCGRRNFSLPPSSAFLHASVLTLSKDRGKEKFLRTVHFSMPPSLPFPTPIPDFYTLAKTWAEHTTSSTLWNWITKIGMSVRFKILAFSKLVGTRLGDAFLHQLPHAFGGMNGSVVYEPDRPENAGLKKFLKDKGSVWYSIAAFSTTSDSIRQICDFQII
ncbi:unnamed protein product [Fraxinus pennsylvanica]|uniref:Uncharacterized protein n=1 Tax=Fraxinus pennsylvanica TaxID=56036 RepID=A0AAD2DJ20_9LAMI|nr:unnamed protein product [Fraxinus pennsylvanica]